MNTCNNCSAPTKNPKFCSASCAAACNNKQFPKRTSKNKCQACQAPIHWNKTYCQIHEQQQCRKTKNGIITKEVILRQVIYRHHHKSSAFALVRNRARALAKKYKMTSCAICGYVKHVEISHKKAISSFDLDTPIDVINAKDNIWPLCPNHHWEYDNGLLDV